MINAIEKNLQRGIELLNCITDEDYCNNTTAPYYSSIGGHMRHILDVFDCIFDGLKTGKINLIQRKRNQLVELHTDEGIQYFNQILEKLGSLNDTDLDQNVVVTDDLGLGTVEANYSIAAILIQAHSHAIHHYASVGYIISQLGIQLPDEDFGFNPTTPKSVEG